MYRNAPGTVGVGRLAAGRRGNAQVCCPLTREAADGLRVLGAG